MDTSAKKTKIYKGEPVSETRFFVNTWLEKQIPTLAGSVVNVGAGGSLLPKKLLGPNVTKYTTCDLKWYGDSKNPVDVYADIMNLPAEWTNTWDAAICVEVMECVENPFKAMDELYRILKPNGVLLITAPFNVGWFGYGSTPESLKKRNPVKDYWRITKDGWQLLTKQFASVTIDEFGGTGTNDRFSYCVRAVK